MMKQLTDAMEEEIQNSDKTIEILQQKEKKNLERIQILEKRVEEFEKPKQSNLVETQTLANPDDSISIACNLCIYIATCEE